MKLQPRFLILPILLLTLALAGPADAHRGERGASWETFSERHDADGNGAVTAEEFAGPERLFTHLDGDENGEITAQDFEVLRQTRQALRGSFVLRVADTDRNRQLSATEWQTFLADIDPEGSGVVDVELLAGMLPQRGPRPGTGGGERLVSALDRDGDQILEIDDLQTLFDTLDADGNGEIAAAELPQRPRRGPRHGRGGGIVGSADQNQDQVVTLDEWTAFVTALDADGDGTLDSDELAGLRPSGSRGPRGGRGGSPRSRLDANGDQIVQTSELLALFETLDRNGDQVIDGSDRPQRGSRQGRRGPRGGR